MATAISPAPFQLGLNLEDGGALNDKFGHPIIASQDGITATAGGGQSGAFQLTTHLNRVTTVATAADSVALVKAYVGKVVFLTNAGANAMQVFGNYVNGDTINSIATGTGLSQPAGTTWLYTCTTVGNWIANNVTGVFNSIRVLSAGGFGGTFVANGATPVTVTNTNIATTSIVLISLNTVGGTVGAIPHVATITAATSFTVVGTASDTSTYNYMIVETV